MNAERPSRLVAILKGLCPLCLQGHVFAGAMKMNDRCPSCGLAFSREPGYFSGAMYFSYLLGVGVIVVLFLALSVVMRGSSFTRLLLVAGLLFVPLIPGVFRYSRILWIYFDRHFEP